MPLFKETALNGYPIAVRKVLGYDEMALSTLWKTTLVNHFQKYMDVALTTPVGNKILFAKNAGDMNISPSISPDGKYVIFISEKDILSLDLYLADAKTGRIIRKISSIVHNSEIDAFNFIESSGSWSPDGKRFVFTVFAGGKNKLLMVNVDKGKVIGEFSIPGVPAFSNPCWSPTGDQIVVSGMVEGINNLYLFDLKTKDVKQLTNGPYAYMQPTWSNDGKYLVFSTDKPLNDSSFIDTKGSMSLALMNMETNKMEIINIFQGAKNLNPLFSSDNKSIYFLSNRDGFRNLYEYKIDSAKVYQLTKFFTGITGITEFSPAASVARDRDLFTYTYFYGGKYSIYAANRRDFNALEVKSDSINFDAATLPPLQRVGKNTVDEQLSNRSSLKLVSTDKFMTSPYRPKFQLDYISQVNAGVAFGRFGTGMAGSVLGIWSDMVGQNQLYGMLSVNGEIYDAGGQVAYINSKNKINWAVSVSHIPYVSAYQKYPSMEIIDIGGDGVADDTLINAPYSIFRIFEDKISLFAFRPLSKTKRIEFGVSQAWKYYRWDVINQRYDWHTKEFLPSLSNKERKSTPPGYSIQSADAAYVVDNSIYGINAPMKGYRSRIGIEKAFGEFEYVTALLDERFYLYKKPVTFAFRAYHYGRYGSEADDLRLGQINIGYPWYIRGYDYVTFADESTIPGLLDITMNDLFGSKMGLFNFEIRIPFTGPKKIALIDWDFMYSDLVLFTDMGIIWNNSTHPTLKLKKTREDERVPLISVGGSLRINVLGYMVVEPYYAYPMQNGGFSNPSFGVNFIPGW
jgi:Tol biopolymer transport system component